MLFVVPGPQFVYPSAFPSWLPPCVAAGSFAQCYRNDHSIDDDVFRNYYTLPRYGCGPEIGPQGKKWINFSEKFINWRRTCTHRFALILTCAHCSRFTSSLTHTCLCQNMGEVLMLEDAHQSLHTAFIPYVIDITDSGTKEASKQGTFCWPKPRLHVQVSKQKPGLWDL